MLDSALGIPFLILFFAVKVSYDCGVIGQIEHPLINGIIERVIEKELLGADVGSTDGTNLKIYNGNFFSLVCGGAIRRGNSRKIDARR